MAAKKHLTLPGQLCPKTTLSPPVVTALSGEFSLQTEHPSWHHRCVSRAHVDDTIKYVVFGAFVGYITIRQFTGCGVHPGGVRSGEFLGPREGKRPPTETGVRRRHLPRLREPLHSQSKPMKTPKILMSVMAAAGMLSLAVLPLASGAGAGGAGGSGAGGGSAGGGAGGGSNGGAGGGSAGGGAGGGGSHGGGGSAGGSHGGGAGGSHGGGSGASASGGHASLGGHTGGMATAGRTAAPAGATGLQGLPTGQSTLSRSPAFTTGAGPRNQREPFLSDDSDLRTPNRRSASRPTVRRRVRATHQPSARPTATPQLRPGVR